MKDAEEARFELRAKLLSMGLLLVPEWFFHLAPEFLVTGGTGNIATLTEYPEECSPDGRHILGIASD